jgi:hypothetical protein
VARGEGKDEDLYISMERVDEMVVMKIGPRTSIDTRLKSLLGRGSPIRSSHVRTVLGNTLPERLQTKWRQDQLGARCRERCRYGTSIMTIPMLPSVNVTWATNS